MVGIVPAGMNVNDFGFCRYKIAGDKRIFSVRTSRDTPNFRTHCQVATRAHGHHRACYVLTKGSFNTPEVHTNGLNQVDIDWVHTAAAHLDKGLTISRRWHGSLAGL